MFKTRAGILKQFTKMVAQLEAVAKVEDAHAATQKAEEGRLNNLARVAAQKAQTHAEEASLSRETASKIRDLIGG